MDSVFGVNLRTLRPKSQRFSPIYFPKNFIVYILHLGP